MDHNLVGIDVSLKDIKVGGNNSLRRSWKLFNKERFIEKLNLRRP